MEKTGWKVVAIIFIILFILTLAIFLGIMSLGVSIIDKENECSINICKNYDSFYFDSTNSICYCYANGELAYQEYLR